MRRTLLEMVQEILSDLNSDEINSIGDTIESEQVALILKAAYEDIIENRDIPSLNTLFQLEGLSNTLKPTHFEYPDNIQLIHWLKYDYEVDSDISYQPLTY